MTARDVKSEVSFVVIGGKLTFDASMVAHGCEGERLHLDVLDAFRVDVPKEGQLVLYGVVAEGSIQTALTCKTTLCHYSAHRKDRFTRIFQRFDF